MSYRKPNNYLGGAISPNKAFPQRTITAEIAMDDYEKLQNYPVVEQPFSNVGNRALDYFIFLKRKSTPLSKWSHTNAWKDKDERKKIISGCVKIENARKNIDKVLTEDDLTDGKLIDCMNMRYGSLSQFKPVVAKYLYTKFKATKVLDFTAGWGGRLLGAMSINIDYIGVDTNITLKPEYDKIISTYPSKSKVKMIWEKAETVDYSKLDYDFVFTSPPYINLEKYENMPSYDDNSFFDEFLYPTIENTFRNLPKNKWYCLNIPIDMYDKLRKDKVMVKETLRLPLNKYYRNGSGNRYVEYIYCWKK
tara:strand:+ start:1739 stop:2656 length:918 start_codon:yes stop_codon:yes gene_type:complete